MRLETQKTDSLQGAAMYGSVQQVGEENLHHFASFEKLLEIIRETADQTAIKPLIQME